MRESPRQLAVLAASFLLLAALPPLAGLHVYLEPARGAMAHGVLVMKDGEVVEEGETRTVFDNPVETYTRTLVAAAHLA